ncbi:MAG: type II/IV secretion system ATPase subunit [Halobacteriota archaeon]|nr:type II/IV secretion system ATPase subunit [Halobacteriota archaeon]
MVADNNLKEAIKKNPHLGRYLKKYKDQVGKLPDFQIQLSRDLKGKEVIDVLYPVGDPVFIHTFRNSEGIIKYKSIEPEMSKNDRIKYQEILDRVLERAPFEDVPESDEELTRIMSKLFDESVSVVEKLGEEKKGGLFKQREIEITKEQHNILKYFIHRDVIGSSVIEPLLRDPYLEDIHSIGMGNIHIIHKIFDMVETSVHFETELELVKFLRNMAERMGRPVSEAHPIQDGALPDGSRINMIYSDDISRKGGSFTIRKFSATPISIVQLVKWGTLSAELAGYLWTCLENGQSIFVCGETASGKTTTLNAMLSFILPQSKIFTAEDTAEVLPPHDIWQQLITRDEGPPDSRVDLFDLLKAALRSRPNYIIVGEIRGAEGAVAFQAMQTGHPVIATFHASAVKKMIQRFTGDPINVPVTFIDNLNVCLIQQAVYQGGKFLRRCTAIEELEGYFEEAGGVLTRAVFQWDSRTDRHIFRGNNNSFILEEKIANKLGYPDKRMIYDDVMLRARIIAKMAELDIVDYFRVNDIIKTFFRKGVSALPFRV